MGQRGLLGKGCGTYGLAMAPVAAASHAVFDASQARCSKTVFRLVISLKLKAWLWYELRSSDGLLRHGGEVEDIPEWRRLEVLPFCTLLRLGQVSS